MKSWKLLGCVLAALLAFGPLASAFEPIAETEKPLYKFQLDKLFYPDEAAWKAEMEKSRTDATGLESMKGKVLQSAKDLLNAVTLFQQLYDRRSALQSYAYFRSAINTDDNPIYEAQDKLDAEIDSRISFFRVELKGLNEAKLQEYIAAENGLKKYEYFLADIARMGPHTLTEEKESILSGLAPNLTSWPENFFQKVFDRNAFPVIKVEDKEFNIHVDFDGLLKNADRAVREQTFTGYYEFFKKNADLLAFALRQLLTASNAVAKMRGFETYYHQTLFERYVTRAQVDAMYKQLEEALPVYRAYQQFRADTLKADLALPEVKFFDYDMPPKSARELRFSIASAGESLNEGIKVLGASYALELGKLLDPKNGRLDIVGGAKRRQGAFCCAYFGYFMDNYQGFLDDVSTMAHEAGHAIHFQLVKNARGSEFFGEGPSYMTESFAMFNEWLLREHLLATTKDPEVLASLRWSVVSEMMYLWELARRAKFEMAAYDRVAADEIKDEKGFNQVCLDIGKQYDLFFKTHPEMEFHWIRKHHYWTTSTYYVNYVFAHILALKYLEMYQADPAGFPAKYVAMVSAGFDRPATKLLKDFLDIDFEDPNMTKGVFQMIQKQFDSLKNGK